MDELRLARYEMCASEKRDIERVRGTRKRFRLRFPPNQMTMVVINDFPSLSYPGKQHGFLIVK
eukprot:scaffold2510_cov169-Amphora_coffeaeformis.AAC.39